MSSAEHMVGHHVMVFAGDYLLQTNLQFPCGHAALIVTQLHFVAIENRCAQPESIAIRDCSPYLSERERLTQFIKSNRNCLYMGVYVCVSDFACEHRTCIQVDGNIARFGCSIAKLGTTFASLIMPWERNGLVDERSLNFN